jgi:hypothetical protein
MTIDLTKDGILTLESVQRLLASANDKTYTQVRVTKAGMAFIATDRDPAPSTDYLMFCLEGFDAGRDYVGSKAAEDQDWIGRIYKVLKDNWPEPMSFYIDIF